MLRIREAQREALGEATRRRFLGMMERYLREHFPRWSVRLSDEDLRGWLAYALDKAARYGVTTEPEAAQLILLLIVLGVDADEDDADEARPWVREVLSSRRLAPIGKVKKLIARARAEGVRGIEHVVVYDEMGS